ncbi:flagellar hook-length control protein FliK [Thalassobaculum sp.]|uniref:flagellar hook-length control protein FliK n=1 Tax=Thalassobaculum sp. TaxID=2022740 RepID=UPI003B5B3E58
MDLNAIDPRASSPAADSRKSKSSTGDVFQGVMQMMAKIDENRTENQARERSDATRPSQTDKAERERRADRKEKAPREDETADTETDSSKKKTAPADEPVVAQLPIEMTQTAPVQTGDVELAVVPDDAATEQMASVSGQAAPASATTAGDQQAPAKQAAAAQVQAQPVQTQPAAQPAQAAPETPADDMAALVRQALGQRDQIEGAAKTAGAQKPGDGQKADTASGRADALMGAKVTVEAPVPVARSQGVSSAVLVQAQQAAAGGQVQTSNANGGAGTLHVGGNQPTFVGADGSSNNAATGQSANGNNAGGQNAGANNQSQNQGQGGQPNPQQVGVSFGATIGQRGFGGEASRAQFQEILATRTARAQPASLAGGEAGRPTGVSSSSSTPLTMAGVGGPQSTHTSASPVDRAAATAHGRPGANLGTPADQVAMKMSATAKDGGGKVTIRLSPEELGKVDIRMEISKEGLVRAVVAVDRPETLELLQRDAKGLERVLQDAGLQTDGESLEFDLRGDGGQYADDADEGEGGKAPADGALASQSIDGDSVAADQQGDEGSGGVKADGSLDLVA